MFLIAVLIISAYFLGSIPFGLVIGKKVKGIDVRDVGSGNIGTANCVRALGPFWGGVTFICDVLKGAIPVLLSLHLPARLFGGIPDVWLQIATIIIGFSAIMGHNYSIFLKFKGGKGIATSFGVFISLDWRVALLSFLLWFIVISLTKISSLGSLMGAVGLPLFMILFKKPLPYIVFAFIAGILAFYSHRANLARLLKGQESKITDKAKAKNNHDKTEADDSHDNKE